MQAMLQDKVVVIIGGAGLLGRRIARNVALAGGLPVVADIDAERACQAAGEAGAGLDAKALSMVTDISSEESLKATMDAVVDAHGRMDAVVLAAYPRNSNYGRKLDDVTYEDFCENVSLHLGGYFHAAKLFAQRFRKLGGGNVLVCSSIYGSAAPRFEIYEGTPMTMPVEYAAIKSALNHLVKYFAKYYKKTGVRFNCISPGGVLDAQPESFLAAYNSHGMTKGMLDPEDFDGAILFLLSDMSVYVNGQNLVVDDGWTL